MSMVGCWPVRPGRWAGLAKALGLAEPDAPATLTLQGAGHWAVSLAGTVRPLRLVHAWPAFAWITLRFQDDAPAARGKPLEFTVWKAGLKEGEWRHLRRCVAVQQAMPDRSHNKDTP